MRCGRIGLHGSHTPLPTLRRRHLELAPLRLLDGYLSSAAGNITIVTTSVQFRDSSLWHEEGSGP